MSPLESLYRISATDRLYESLNDSISESWYHIDVEEHFGSTTRILVSEKLTLFIVEGIFWIVWSEREHWTEIMRWIVRRIIKLMMNATYNFIYECRIIRTKPKTYLTSQLAQHKPSNSPLWIVSPWPIPLRICSHKLSFVSCEYYKRSLFKTQ